MTMINNVEVKLDEIWYVKARGAFTVTTARIVNITAKTIAIQNYQSVSSTPFTNRYLHSDLLFIEKVEDAPPAPADDC